MGTAGAWRLRRRQGGRRQLAKPAAASQGTRALALRQMPLVFGDVRRDLGEFPHLMPHRLGIPAGEFGSAAAALGWFKRHDGVAFAGGHQWPLVLLMPRRPAPLLLGLRLLQRRLGVRRLHARRPRRILRRLGQPRFQLGRSAPRSRRSPPGATPEAQAATPRTAPAKSAAATTCPRFGRNRPPRDEQFFSPGRERLPSSQTAFLAKTKESLDTHSSSRLDLQH